MAQPPIYVHKTTMLIPSLLFCQPTAFPVKRVLTCRENPRRRSGMVFVERECLSAFAPRCANALVAMCSVMVSDVGFRFTNTHVCGCEYERSGWCWYLIILGLFPLKYLNCLCM